MSLTILKVLPDTINPAAVDYFRRELKLVVDESELPIDELTSEELAKLVDGDTGLKATANGIVTNKSFTTTDLYRAVLGLPLENDSSPAEKQVRTTPLSRKDVVQFHKELGLRLGEKDLKYLSEDDIRRLAKENKGLQLCVESIVKGNSALAEHLYAVTAKLIATRVIDLNLN